MRLIDADELIKRMRKWMPKDPCGREQTVEEIVATDIAVSVCMEIEETPTAFDKEKVKEQIQIFRSKFECTCCPKNIGKHIPVSCDECMDTFAKANIVIVEKGGIE